MIDRVKIFLTSSLQNLVAVSHAVCVDVGDPKKLGTLPPLQWGMSDRLETCVCPTYFTMANLVGLTYGDQFGMVGPPLLKTGRV